MSAIAPTALAATGVVWTGITEADTGAAVAAGHPSPPSVVVRATGTFNGGTLTIEQAKDAAGPWTPALSLGGSIASGEDAAFSAPGAAAISTAAGRWFRVANDAGGTSEDIDVFLFHPLGR